MSIIKWQSFNTADSPTWSPSLASLASGSFSLSSVIDNTTGLYTDAWFLLNLGSTVTTGSGAPSLPLWILDEVDGTNAPSPPGGTAAAAPVSLIAGTYAAVASVATQVIVIPRLVIGPTKFALQIQNNLGVAFPASGITAGFYRTGLQVV